MLDKEKDWLKDVKITKKTIGIAFLLIVILSFIIIPLIFIILVSLAIPIGLAILYYVQLMKQPISLEEYYLKFVEKNYIHLDDNLLIKMFEVSVNNKRNFLFSYLALLGGFIFATLSNKDYFKTITSGFLNLYYWNIGIGIIEILILVYATFRFDRYTLKELEMLFKAKEKLQELKRENISPPIIQKE